MTTKFKCPHCGEQIEVSEALTHQIEEQVLESLKDDHKRQLQDAIKNAEENALKKINEKYLHDLNNAKMEREKASLDIAEMKKKLEDTQKALSDAQSKAKQGSQQLQGEVLELDLEEKLKNSFVYDEINPIVKGVQGADILQIVRNQTGKVAGVILWETKRAKWTTSWIPKLKEDGRKNDATMTVLVCENLPNDIEHFKVMNGVVVTSLSYCLSLAAILRRNLMLIAQAKSTSVNKDEKLELLYEYIQSDAFRHRFEAFADGIVAMEGDLLTERRSMERIWKKRETQIKRIQLNTSRMFGELQGEMGNALPDIKTLKLESGE